MTASTKYYTDAAGLYLGGFAPAPAYDIRTPQEPIPDPDTGEMVPRPPLVQTVTPEVVPPPGGIEVPHPPADARAVWDFDAQEWQEPAPALPVITARQCRLMLLAVGITPAMVEAELGAIQDETDRARALIEWEYASAYERTHPLIDQMAAAFDLPAVQVDALWLAAADL
ncbi:hypothetical protein [Polymorphum gilvum]|uniref:Uncharacterized protein n=1 Tax=Polymorphum gilvum (strain LMG 25793 / CGMCC 1.9160 / SL003B-26A1) TaxID=991905 RepID=F2J633_POLGS|nr:hypothetical protein [Polymorphum gilvum]ADZ72397.1 hypothetical protein SL003B_3977 [Polymorphum gilvum SL003B-26A1]